MSAWPLLFQSAGWSHGETLTVIIFCIGAVVQVMGVVSVAAVAHYRLKKLEASQEKYQDERQKAWDSFVAMVNERIEIAGREHSRYETQLEELDRRVGNLERRSEQDRLRQP